jgi:hypothetical protein
VCHAAVIFSIFQNLLDPQGVPKWKVKVGIHLLILDCCRFLIASSDSVYIIPWLASPLDENSLLSPHLRQRADASPIELFYDVFLVANLATFSATHEITDIKGWWAIRSRYKSVSTDCCSGVVVRWVCRHHLVYLASSRPLRPPVLERLHL